MLIKRPSSASQPTDKKLMMCKLGIMLRYAMQSEGYQLTAVGGNRWKRACRPSPISAVICVLSLTFIFFFFFSFSSHKLLVYMSLAKAKTTSPWRKENRLLLTTAIWIIWRPGTTHLPID
jgi:hypothetical protein